MKKVFLTAMTLSAIGLFIFYRYYRIENREAALRAVFMNVGQGDATLILFPNEETMLVDCGRDALTLSALGRNLPWRDRDIDYLIATHPDADHYAGCIDVLRRYRVKHIYFNGFEKDRSPLLQSFFDAINAEVSESGALFTIITGEMVKLSIAGAVVEFLYPDHDIRLDPRVPGSANAGSNNTSIVMKISYGESDMLLTGDMEEPLEKYLTEKWRNESLGAEILKVGHHGSQSSSHMGLLSAVKPLYCVISSGKNNQYGHPSPRTLKRLKRARCAILRTDEFGDILAEIGQGKINLIYDKP